MKPTTKSIKSITLLEKLYGERPEDKFEIEEINKIIEFKTRKIDNPTDFSKCVIDQSKRFGKIGRPPNPKAIRMMEDIEKMDSGKVLKINVEGKKEATRLEVHLHRHKKCLTNKDVSFIHRENDDTAYITKGIGSMKGRLIKIKKE